MDKNSTIGLVIIGAILMGWMYWMSPSPEQAEKQKKQMDSLALVQQKQAEIKKQTIAPKVEISSPNIATDTTTIAISDSAKNVLKKNIYGAFADAVQGEKKIVTLENELLKINVSTLGGRIESVELKNYFTFDKKPIKLFDADSSKMAIEFSAYSKGFSTDSFYFAPEGTAFAIKGDEKKSMSMRLYAGSKNKYIEYVYGLKGNDYMIDFKINIVGMNDIIASNTNELNLKWAMHTPSHEKSLENERNASTIDFKYIEDDSDKLSERSDEKKSLESKVKWIAFKQQFFTSTIIANTAFEKPTDIESINNINSKKYAKIYTANLTIPYTHQTNEGFGMQFYFGPNKYTTLKSYGIGLEDQIYLGWKISSWFNKWIVIPVFNFLEGFKMNYGLIIFILTIIIKLLIFPIAYKMYMSSAKMRVLKPEIDEINKKFGNDDPMKKQQATMALYKKAGVNPLAGCLPLLLQIPILTALFSFFPSSIELRQQPFLWTNDLSTYDSILSLPFNIPFYGSHVSLWALLMTASTVLYTMTNSQLMGTNDQMPGMKWMMYLMPIVFLGVMNSYSAGLSYYYFLANMITYLQTVLMRRFIDEDKLHKLIQENKKKPVKQSGFQQRLEKMMKEKQQQAQQKKK